MLDSSISFSYIDLAKIQFYNDNKAQQNAAYFDFNNHTLLVVCVVVYKKIVEV